MEEKLKALSIISRFGVYIIFLILVVIGSITAPHIFLTPRNFLDIVEAGSLMGIAAIGVSFITYSGHFCDMSVPGMLALSGIISVQFLPYGLPVCILTAVLSCACVGAVNGYMVGKWKANPIIWTLAMQFILGGILRWAYSGNQIFPDLVVDSESLVAGFSAIYRYRVFGAIPMVVIVFVAAALVCHFIYTKTHYGKCLKMTGSNYTAARFSGINAKKTVWIAFIMSGVFTGIAGVMLASLQKVGSYSSGEGYDFDTVVAIVLGGMALFGGRGSAIGVFGGVVTLGLLSNVMILLGMGTFEQYFVKGLVFILIVWLNSFALRKLGKDYA